MKLIIIIFSVVCIISCSIQKKELKEGRIALEGIAAKLPDHSEKSDCAGVIVKGQNILFKGNYKSLRREDLGKKIKVSGVLKKKDSPMFIWDEKKNPNGVLPQGIPMPPGTDIEKERVYYIIENPIWEIKK